MTVADPTIATGIPGLDPVIGGGLTPGAFVFIVGAPGAGKTVLASQIIFHAVRTGVNALVLTTLSEGNVKLIQHLHSFDFFDEAPVGNALHFLSLHTVLGGNLDTAATALVRTIRETGARMVLIDGVQGIDDFLSDAPLQHRLFAALSAASSYLDTTIIVTFSGNARDPELVRHLTTADVVVNMDYAVVGQRHTRYIDIIKHRGNAQLAGLHHYAITSQGITVFPRLEARALPEARPRPSGRAAFGLPELDALLGGGPNVGTITIIAGAPGTGKTTLALTWALAAAQPEDRTVMVSFLERKVDLREKATTFNLQLDQALNSGALSLIWLSSSEIEPDMVAATVLSALTPTTTRVVIDDISVLLRTLGSRASDYLAALSNQLYAAGVTSLLLFEIEAFTGFHFNVGRTPLSQVADNALVIQQVAVDHVMYRLLAVLKMRFSDHQRVMRQLVLDSEGVRVLAPAATKPGLLEDARDNADKVS
ncbi:MAG: ATPase domain-containing protein [Herpetosiphon sp.]